LAVKPPALLDEPPHEKMPRIARPALLGSVVILTSAMPASADGWRRGGRAHWRSSAYAFNDRITYNVITPYYYPYYGSHYSYVRPDPVPPPTYVVYPAVVPVCWSGGLAFGPRLWVC
jgi:hypothetical protein